MKKIALMKPVGEIKSYSVCLVDDFDNTAVPLVFLKQGPAISDATYEEIINELKITCRQDYVPEVSIPVEGES